MTSGDQVAAWIYPDGLQTVMAMWFGIALVVICAGWAIRMAHKAMGL